MVKWCLYVCWYSASARERPNSFFYVSQLADETISFLCVCLVDSLSPREGHVPSFFLSLSCYFSPFFFLCCCLPTTTFQTLSIQSFLSLCLLYLPLNAAREQLFLHASKYRSGDILPHLLLSLRLSLYSSSLSLFLSFPLQPVKVFFFPRPSFPQEQTGCTKRPPFSYYCYHIGAQKYRVKWSLTSSFILMDESLVEASLILYVVVMHLRMMIFQD